MKQSRGQVWINGAEVGPEAALVSVFDRGFLYGDSVFETLRTYQGCVFAVDEHLERLAESARRVSIDLPVPLATLRLELLRAARGSPYQESYLRLVVTRGIGALGLDPSSAELPLRVLLVMELSPPPQSDYEDGIAVASFASGRHTDSLAVAGSKIGNYLVAVLAAEQARKVGAKESLIVDGAGRVVEGATSNLFWVEGQGANARLWTPPLESGILAGITRKYILQVAEDEGVEVSYGVPSLDELGHVAEVFVSSSIREILPVVSIDGQQVGNGKPGALTQRLYAAFRRAVVPLAVAASG